MGVDSTQPSTVDEEDTAVRARETPAETLAFVIAWCAEAPWRVGDLAWVPPDQTRVLGRGPELAADPYPRLKFVRQRPDSLEIAPLLSAGAISRVQCVVSARGSEELHLRNVGRCSLLVEGVPVDDAFLGPGHVAQIGQQLLLLCIRRPPVPSTHLESYPTTAFGTPDGLGIVGESAAIWDLRRRLAIVGPRSGHVLFLGPSGSGKELCARGIHILSDRRDKALVPRNAATIPESIADAELFGNAKNYPNPGMTERRGLVGEADQSTLFLDEIADLEPTLQVHLLRVLDAGEYQRLGESMTRRTDLRVVAATNKDPSQLRVDLLARFGYRIDVPGLNTRREDIPLLIHFLLQRLADSDPQLASLWRRGAPDRPLEAPIDLCRSLLERHYTSHLRELEQLLLEALVAGAATGWFASKPVRQPLPEIEALPAVEEPASDGALPVGGLTPQRIQSVLDEHNGRLETAYRALGLKNRFALSRLIARHRLEVRRRPSQPPRRQRPDE